MWFRLMSFLFLAGCIFVGVEIYTKGTAGAFGGALSGISQEGGSSGPAATPLERIRQSTTGSRDRQLSRVERQLGEPSVGLDQRRTYRGTD